VEKMCKVLDIKRGFYYAWLKRPDTKRKREDSILTIEIKRVHKEFDKTYGARRVTAQLKKEGIACGKNRVSMIMLALNLFSIL
jgi:putative transposase